MKIDCQSSTRLSEELGKFNELILPLMLKGPNQINDLGALLWQFNIKINNLLIGGTEDPPKSLIEDISAPISRILDRFCEMILAAIDNEDPHKINALAEALASLNTQIEIQLYQKWIESITYMEGIARKILEYFGQFPLSTEVSRQQIIHALGVTDKKDLAKMDASLNRLSTRIPSPNEKFSFKKARIGIYKIVKRPPEDINAAQISETDNDAIEITSEAVEQAAEWARANSLPGAFVNKIMVFLAKCLGKDITVHQIAEAVQISEKKVIYLLKYLRRKKYPKSPYKLECYGRRDEAYILKPRSNTRIMDKLYNAEETAEAVNWIKACFGKTKVHLYFMLILANNLGRYVSVAEIKAVDPEITEQNLCTYMSRMRQRLIEKRSSYLIEKTWGHYRLVKAEK